MKYTTRFVVLHKNGEQMTRTVDVPEGEGPDHEPTQNAIRDALAYDLDCGRDGVRLISVIEKTGKERVWRAKAEDVALANRASSATLPPEPRRSPPSKEAIKAANKVDLQNLCTEWPIPPERVNPNQNKEQLAQAIEAYFYPPQGALTEDGGNSAVQGPAGGSSTAPPTTARQQ